MNHIVLGIWIVGFLLCLGTNALPASALRQGEPTDEQYQAAKKAVAKLGGQFVKYTYSDSKRTVYILHMRPRTRDDDLKKLPHLSFPFGLVLGDTKVTDAGLKEVANLKTLDALNLHN